MSARLLMVQSLDAHQQDTRCKKCKKTIVLRSRQDKARRATDALLKLQFFRLNQSCQNSLARHQHSTASHLMTQTTDVEDLLHLFRCISDLLLQKDIARFQWQFWKRVWTRVRCWIRLWISSLGLQQNPKDLFPNSLLFDPFWFKLTTSSMQD